MANASSRARAVNKQNTAVLYYEPSEDIDRAPVSTARVVEVGTAAANSGSDGVTLQLVGGLVDGDEATSSGQPRVVEVEPPRAAARKRSAQRGPTRVIAYNVRIVASEETAEFVEAQAVPRPGPTDIPQGLRDDAQYRGAQERGFEDSDRGAREQYDLRGRSHRHQEMQLEVPIHGRHGTGDRQFVMPNHAQRAPQNVQFQAEPGRVPTPQKPRRVPTPNHVQRAPQNLQFDAEPRRVPAPHGPRADMPRAERMPPGMQSPRGQIPMSLFGALENVGGMRAQASAAAGSYKQLIAQQLAAGHGPLLSNRNLCIAVGAYALILFLLALFTG